MPLDNMGSALRVLRTIATLGGAFGWVLYASIEQSWFIISLACLCVGLIGFCLGAAYQIVMAKKMADDLRFASVGHPDREALLYSANTLDAWAEYQLTSTTKEKDTKAPAHKEN